MPYPPIPCLICLFIVSYTSSEQPNHSLSSSSDPPNPPLEKLHSPSSHTASPPSTLLYKKAPYLDSTLPYHPTCNTTFTLSYLKPTTHCASTPAPATTPFLASTFPSISDQFSTVSPQQTRFLKYISPLLSPLHPLTQGIPRAYLQIIPQHELTAPNEQHSILNIALCLAAIQDTAAKITLYLIPPFVPIEILHRTICIILLKNTSPRSFSTAHTARITTRSLLGRF